MMPLVPLSDGTVTLRAWRPEDADWYAEQSRDSEIQRFTTESPDLDPQTVRTAIERFAAASTHGHGRSSSVRVVKVKRPAGPGWFDVELVLEDDDGTWLYGPIGTGWSAPHDEGQLLVPVLLLLQPQRPWVVWWVDDPADRRIELDVCLPRYGPPRAGSTSTWAHARHAHPERSAGTQLTRRFSPELCLSVGSQLAPRAFVVVSAAPN